MHKDGFEIPTLISLVPLYDEAGVFLHSVTIIVDLTMQKQAEQALRLQVNAFDNFADAMIITDRNGIIKWGNRSLEKLTGWRADELIGEKAGSNSRSEVHDKAFFKQMWDTILAGDVYHGIVYNKRRNGEIYAEDLTITPIADEKGEVAEFVAIKRDVTEELEAQNNLKTAVLRLETLVSSMQDGIILENEHRKVALANKALCDIFSIPIEPEVMIGSDCESSAHQVKFLMKDPEAFIARIDDILAKDEIVINDYLYLLDGRVLSRNYIPIQFEGENFGHLWQYTDVTDQVRASEYETLLKQLGFNLSTISNQAEALKSLFKLIQEVGIIDYAAISMFNEDGDLVLKEHAGLNADLKKVATCFKSDSFEAKFIAKGQPLFAKTEDIFAGSEFYKEHLANGSFYGLIPILNNHTVEGGVMIGFNNKTELSFMVQNTLETMVKQLGATLQRIQMEMLVKNSEANLEKMFDTVGDMIVISDFESNVLRVNKVVNDVFGYEIEDFRQLQLKDVRSNEYDNMTNELYAKIRQGGLHVFTMPFQTKDGRVLPVEVNATMGQWFGKDVIFSVGRDITERLEAEERLRTSEARWQMALESSGDAIWDWNISTDETFYSRQWKEMLGYSDEELEMTTDVCLSLIHPDQIYQYNNRLKQYLSGTTESFESEQKMLCKDGSYKWILNRGKIISYDKKGKPHRMIGTITDISSRKEFEKSLMDSLIKEKELNELKSKFVSMTSHEFRTPLASILMASETLSLHWDKMKVDDIKERLGRITKNVDFLKKILEKVLSLSHLESGKMSFSPEEICVNEEINEILESDSFGSCKSHKISFKADADKQIMLNADKQMVRQLLINLLGNACKYSDEGSEVAILLNENADSVMLSVKDNGIGIKPEDLKDVFKPFKRGENVGNIHGTGLGLALAKEFVQRHGGYIDVKSELGKGTLFSVVFPKVMS